MTGAAHGIGRAITIELVTADFDVLALDVDRSALDTLRLDLPEFASNIDLGVVDVSDPESVDAIPAMLGDTTLDVLVNNAGVGIEHPFYATALDDWRRAIGIDLTGPFLVARACWRHIRKPGGAIVNVSSIHGSRPLHHQSAYAAAKGGLENLTRGMALDAAAHGVRVNAVAPGFTRTRLITDWLDSEGDKASRLEAEVNRIIPMGRIADPAEVAAVVVWLASSAASYVTGAVIPVDGGLGARAFARNEDL